MRSNPPLSQQFLAELCKGNRILEILPAGREIVSHLFPRLPQEGIADCLYGFDVVARTVRHPYAGVDRSWCQNSRAKCGGGVCGDAINAELHGAVSMRLDEFHGLGIVVTEYVVSAI